MDDVARIIREWMAEVMEKTGWSAAKWAREAKVAPSTVQKAVKDDYQFVTSYRTLSKLAKAANVEPPDVPNDAPVTQDAAFLPVRYEVGAGLWQEVTDAQTFYGSGPVAPDPAYAGFPQWLERVTGDSMNLIYGEGALAHVVDALALGYAPTHGDHVVMVRRRFGGQAMERTIKEVVRTPSGGLEFWPRSTNARWNKPVVLTEGVIDGDDFEVEIAGLVIGAYLARRR
ncbi:hypothetical protein IWC96_14580 [Brevundimonas sp. BAL450]|uniref:hypothetical protein n=1 Tax=Brevundimonas sp. BAL450 TaxID=1708162 RepID=UPI0018C9C5F5|nr:hypothetical protein [Brevundimonas sp. BAL450]MBG7616501.1 hypothetical protein [Brevundimonas sp. BAL450]